MTWKLGQDQISLYIKIWPNQELGHVNRILILHLPHFSLPRPSIFNTVWMPLGCSILVNRQSTAITMYVIAKYL